MHSCCVSVKRMLPGISEPRRLGKGGGKGEGGGSWAGWETPNPARLTLASLPRFGHLRAEASGFRGRGKKLVKGWF